MFIYLTANYRETMPFSVWLIDLEGVKVWLDIVTGIAILIGGILTAFWAYTKFILERGFLPPAQFNIDCKTVGIQTEY
jgi:hypothetical protein